MGENDYKKEITNLINKCDDLHWLKVIYAYVKKILG